MQYHTWIIKKKTLAKSIYNINEKKTINRSDSQIWATTATVRWWTWDWTARARVRAVAAAGVAVVYRRAATSALRRRPICPRQDRRPCLPSSPIHRMLASPFTRPSVSKLSILLGLSHIERYIYVEIYKWARVRCVFKLAVYAYGVFCIFTLNYMIRYFEIDFAWSLK